MIRFLFEELQEEFILIGIRRNLPYEDGYAYYYLKGYENPERESFDKSVEKLKDFIEFMSNKYPIDFTSRYKILHIGQENYSYLHEHASSFSMIDRK